MLSLTPPESAKVKLRGELKLDYPPEGLHCCIRFPLHLDNLAEPPDIDARLAPETPH